MNGQPTDAQTKALEFFKDASIYALLATLALLAWVSSGVEFSNDGLRLTAMTCLHAVGGVRPRHGRRDPAGAGGASARPIQFRR